MRDIVVDANLIACCGLYCGACGAWRKEKCPGCRDNEKASWCKVRSCCLEAEIGSCAGCKTHSEATDCARFHGFLSRVIGFLLNSNRPACIARIREVGPEAYAAEMAERGRQTLPRRGG